MHNNFEDFRTKFDYRKKQWKLNTQSAISSRKKMINYHKEIYVESKYNLLWLNYISKKEDN